MEEQVRREAVLRRWFDMWLRGDGTGIGEIFAEDCEYVESWGPRYVGRKAVEHWFREWNTRGKVLTWDAGQFFHRPDETAVTWFFHNRMDDGREERFEGVTVARWDEAGKISFLQEYGCRLPHYDPYANGDTAELRNEDMWT